MNTLDLVDIPIIDAAAHIFRRPCLFVNPTAQMLQIATFLAIGPQIYVDGLVINGVGNALIFLSKCLPNGACLYTT